MESQYADILKEFQVESKNLVAQMNEILEKCEGDMSLAQSLEEYGLFVDRIMGGAKSLALAIPEPEHIIHKVADYSAICKAVGYKSSQVWDNEPFYDICVALLMDATEVLDNMVDQLLVADASPVSKLINQHLIDRLKWVSAKFGAEVRASVAVDKKVRMAQGDIDVLLKKLGIG